MESEKLKKFRAKRDKIRQRIAHLKEDAIVASKKADEALELVDEIKASNNRVKK